MKLLLAVPALLLAIACHAADGPYDEGADAKAQIKGALARSAATGVPVLVVFGANWCADCKILDLSMKQGTGAAFFAREFQVVKVDVGRFNRNVDIAESYGVPLKNGIPAVAILSPANQVLYVTRAGELADARNMGDNGIYEFFRQVTPAARTRS
ncbi:MAG TPA: thioredoxin family protein [Casimicrobiaceae bacterium]|nr:thioredoxin family protein [Casimicrobiaceae bacterium]